VEVGVGWLGWWLGETWWEEQVWEKVCWLVSWVGRGREHEMKLRLKDDSSRASHWNKLLFKFNFKLRSLQTVQSVFWNLFSRFFPQKVDYSFVLTGRQLL
jgi:hypothetical protein